jgi:hypothetical protein
VFEKQNNDQLLPIYTNSLSFFTDCSLQNKVDSRVHVDIKPNSRTARIQEIKEMRRFGREEHWRKLDAIAARL